MDRCVRLSSPSPEECSDRRASARALGLEGAAGATVSRPGNPAEPLLSFNHADHRPRPRAGLWSPLRKSRKAPGSVFVPRASWLHGGSLWSARCFQAPRTRPVSSQDKAVGFTVVESRVMHQP